MQDETADTDDQRAEKGSPGAKASAAAKFMSGHEMSKQRLLLETRYKGRTAST